MANPPRDTRKGGQRRKGWRGKRRDGQPTLPTKDYDEDDRRSTA
jgi:hypothetical protein